MKLAYTPGAVLADYDDQLQYKLQELVLLGRAKAYTTGFRNSDGVIYLRVTVYGLGDYFAVDCCGYDLGLTDELQDIDSPVDQCDSIFSR